TFLIPLSLPTRRSSDLFSVIPLRPFPHQFPFCLHIFQLSGILIDLPVEFLHLACQFVLHNEIVPVKKCKPHSEDKECHKIFVERSEEHTSELQSRENLV